MMAHALPREDTLHLCSDKDHSKVNLALLSYPYVSDFEEFDPLMHEDGVNVVPIRDYQSLEGFHAIILPGEETHGGKPPASQGEWFSGRSPGGEPHGEWPSMGFVEACRCWVI